MFIAEMLLYTYNDLKNSTGNSDRNLYTIRSIAGDKNQIQEEIAISLDETPPGTGYTLVKWNNKLYICEKDIQNPDIPYIKREIKYHPLMTKFK
jgi:hypothetical protein